MDTSIFQLAPWAGPAYLALADAIELAIQAGSVQARDRLPSQRMLADFLGLHVNTVNRVLREARRRGLTIGNRRHRNRGACHIDGRHLRYVAYRDRKSAYSGRSPGNTGRLVILGVLRRLPA
ncbi:MULTISPECIES: GntR family transcriptional regulator [Paraburkholderia]|uniref:GntR family transcriptional regulator n=1 Tax=Paraburkholderia TaxID=1822464 RepID=UPI0009FD60BB|nr:MULTISPECIES: GntR family transcriptional regulator [Paraburkholderia]